MLGLKSKIKSNVYLYMIMSKVKDLLLNKPFSDRKKIMRRFKKVFGYTFDLNAPKTLNEKIQWLKLNDRREINTLCADKLKSREIWKKYGDDGLIPLLFATQDYREINSSNLNEFPCIVKCNNGSGFYKILRNKEDVNWKELQNMCRIWMVQANLTYSRNQEWQYKNIENYIIVEKLLVNENGTIPNDYKFHFINGKLAFVYCSIDREGGDYRVCYDADWHKLPFTWVAKEDWRPDLSDTDISKPVNFNRMLEIGEDLSKNWDLVRVDFYECDYKLYYGEITLYHGSGYDVFNPSEYDLYYGNLLKLSRR